MGKPQIGTDETDIKKYLGNLDKEMDDYKERYISKQWDSIPDFYQGKTHWNQYRPSHKLSPVLNFLRQAIERKTSQMTDQKPMVDVLPFYDPLQDVADAIKEILIAKWSEQSLDMTLTDGVFYGELFGASGWNTLFDKSLRFGKGDSTIQVIDPRNLNFDPNITSSQYLDRAEYIRIEQVVATSLLKWQYNNDKIEADAPFALISERKSKSATGRIVRKIVNRSSTQAVPRSLVKEYWVQDRTMQGGKLKYKGGRHIIVAGGKVVIDEPNPYWDGRFPVELLDWHKNPDSAWGEGEIVDLMELQRLMNKIVAIITENSLLMTNAIWVGDSNALTPEEWDALDNVPGLKVKKKPGSEIRREVGQPLPNGIFNVVTYLEQAIEKLSGNTEVVQGKTPGQVKSGVAIEALQTAAMSIVRLKGRSIESLLERAGQKLVSRIFQYESDERNMWSMKSDMDYSKFKFVAEVLKGKVPEAKKFMKNPKDVWQHFAFKIRPGSSLAMNKWQQSMIAMQMYQAQPKPLIDRLGVLETMDWPGRTDILMRLEQEEAEEMAKQAEMMKVQSELAAQGGGATGSMPSGIPGGSAPAMPNLGSPHAQQAATESIMKG
jgi:hypothetical protein